MMFKLISEGIPIGFFQERKDAENGLKYVESGFIVEE